MPKHLSQSSTANKFLCSLRRSLRFLCREQLDFNSEIEIVGYINVNVDHSTKVDFVLNERMSKKGATNSMNIFGNSYVAKNHNPKPRKRYKDKACSPILQLGSTIGSSSIHSAILRHGEHRQDMGPGWKKTSKNEIHRSLDPEVVLIRLGEELSVDGKVAQSIIENVPKADGSISSNINFQAKVSKTLKNDQDLASSSLCVPNCEGKVSGSDHLENTELSSNTESHQQETEILNMECTTILPVSFETPFPNSDTLPSQGGSNLLGAPNNKLQVDDYNEVDAGISGAAYGRYIVTVDYDNATEDSSYLSENGEGTSSSQFNIIDINDIKDETDSAEDERYNEEDKDSQDVPGQVETEHQYSKRRNYMIGYRQRLKSDPVRYNAVREIEKRKAKLKREEIMGHPKMREIARQNQRERMRKFRQRMAEKMGREPPGSRTKLTVEERRERNRLQKKAVRATWTEEKKLAERQRQRLYKRAQRAKREEEKRLNESENVKTEQQCSTQEEVDKAKQQCSSQEEVDKAKQQCSSQKEVKQEPVKRPKLTPEERREKNRLLKRAERARWTEEKRLAENSKKRNKKRKEKVPEGTGMSSLLITQEDIQRILQDYKMTTESN